jgi:short-subunit dehydrogenase involved in D-alanine esterification of teichoic acids
MQILSRCALLFQKSVIKHLTVEELDAMTEMYAVSVLNVGSGLSCIPMLETPLYAQ